MRLPWAEMGGDNRLGPSKMVGIEVAARRGNSRFSDPTVLDRIMSMRIAGGGGLCLGVSVGNGRVFGLGLPNPRINIGASVGAGICAGVGVGVGIESQLGSILAFLDNLIFRNFRGTTTN